MSARTKWVTIFWLSFCLFGLWVVRVLWCFSDNAQSSWLWSLLPCVSDEVLSFVLLLKKQTKKHYRCVCVCRSPCATSCLYVCVPVCVAVRRSTGLRCVCVAVAESSAINTTCKYQDWKGLNVNHWICPQYWLIKSSMCCLLHHWRVCVLRIWYHLVFAVCGWQQLHMGPLLSVKI